MANWRHTKYEFQFHMRVRRKRSLIRVRNVERGGRGNVRLGRWGEGYRGRVTEAGGGWSEYGIGEVRRGGSEKTEE